MRIVCQGALCVLTAAILATTAGCPQLDPRTSNQGGSNLLSLGAQLANNNLGGMNPDDWQVLTDNLPQFASTLGIDIGDASLPPMSDDEAAALVAFLHANGANTTEDIQSLVAQIEAGTVGIPEELQNWGNQLADLFS